MLHYYLTKFHSDPAFNSKETIEGGTLMRSNVHSGVTESKLMGSSRAQKSKYPDNETFFK